MKIEEILTKRFDAQKTKKVVLLLHKHGLYDALQAAATSFYSRPLQSDYQPQRQALQHLLSQYLCICSGQLNEGNSEDHCSIASMTLFKAVLALSVDAMLNTRLPRTGFHTLLKDVLFSPASGLEAQNWMYYLLASHEMLQLSELAGRAPINSAEGETHQPFSLTWVKRTGDETKKINRTNFVLDLIETFPGLGSNAALHAIIDNTLLPKMVSIRNKDLCAFLNLFGLLCDAGRLRRSQSRGLFLFLRSRLKAVKGETLPARRDYRKLKGEAMADPLHKLFIRDKIKDLFFKYCKGKKDKKLFYTMFPAK